MPVGGAGRTEGAVDSAGIVVRVSAATVGPVGSQYEQSMLTVITGQPATAATELLLGPIARGTTVSLKQAFAISATRGDPNEVRGPLIGLTLFMVVALMLTWLVYGSLRRDVAGKTASYSAVFTDVYGLREGDDVRMAGVRVGRVEKIDLDGKLAKVSFVVQQEQRLFGNTIASVTYQNIVGQRYLGLSLGREGQPGSSCRPAVSSRRNAPNRPSTSPRSSTASSRCSACSTRTTPTTSPRASSHHCRATPRRLPRWSARHPRSQRHSPDATRPSAR